MWNNIVEIDNNERKWAIKGSWIKLRSYNRNVVTGFVWYSSSVVLNWLAWAWDKAVNSISSLIDPAGWNSSVFETEMIYFYYL